MTNSQFSLSRRGVLGAVAATPLAVTRGVPTADAAPKPGPQAPATNLTNLAHLNDLLATITLTASAAHTTYQLAAKPQVTALWVYANVNADGSYTPVGGGDHNTVTNTWGQGSYDVDDIARAVVVYLRHWWRRVSTSTDAAPARV